MPDAQDTLRTLIWIQLDADLLNLLYGNVSRLDEANESDRAGLYHVLGMECSENAVIDADRS